MSKPRKKSEATEEEPPAGIAPADRRKVQPPAPVEQNPYPIADRKVGDPTEPVPPAPPVDDAE